MMAKQMLKRKDGSTSQRGLWDNIRANKGSGKKPTKQMLQQERKIKLKKADKGFSVTSQTTQAPKPSGRVTYYSEKFPGTKVETDTMGFAAGKRRFPYQITYQKTKMQPEGMTIYGKTGRKGVKNIIKSQQAQEADQYSSWPSFWFRGGANKAKAIMTRKPGAGAAAKATTEQKKYGGTIKSKTKKK